MLGEDYTPLGGGSEVDDAVTTERDYMSDVAMDCLLAPIRTPPSPPLAGLLGSITLTGNDVIGNTGSSGNSISGAKGLSLLWILASLGRQVDLKQLSRTLERIRDDDNRIPVAHYTNLANALIILESGFIKPSSDTGYVEMMDIFATANDARLSGAKHTEVRVVVFVPEHKISKDNPFTTNPHALIFSSPGKQYIKNYDPVIAPPAEGKGFIRKILDVFGL